MPEVKFVINAPEQFSLEERQTFEMLLKKQNKVRNVTIKKIDRCKYICFGMIDQFPISIGAIKPKTVSDFNSNKANIPGLQGQFEWELGYLYTCDEHRKNGYGSKVIEGLISKAGNINLMASTELSEGNPMKKLLERKGFEKRGNTWKSQIHGGDLGLFLKFI